MNEYVYEFSNGDLYYSYNTITQYNTYRSDEKHIYLPDSLVTMGPGVFYGASSIEQIRMPQNETLTAVPNYTFYGCKKLHYVRLPSNIVTIGEYAFQGATA